MSTAVRIALQEFRARLDRDDDQREELIEGELILSPGAKLSHAMIVTRLRTLLMPLEQQGYVIANDFACVLGQSMPIPDLSAIAGSRVQTAIENDEWLVGSPELVVEVASPSNRKLRRKAEIYLEHGAEQVWLIYPRTETITIAKLDSTSEARIGEILDFRGVQVPVESIFIASKIGQR